MKVLLTLIVAVVLTQARPEGRVKQDLGVLDEAFFPSTGNDANGMYISPTSGARWPDRGASAGRPATPGPIPTANKRTNAVVHIQTNDAHRTRRSVRNDCLYGGSTTKYVRIGNMCVTVSELQASGYYLRNAEQNTDGHFGTPTVGSGERTWPYGSSTSSEDVFEWTPTTTFRPSRSSDSASASGFDTEQNADDDFGTSTVGSRGLTLDSGCCTSFGYLCPSTETPTMSDVICAGYR